MTQTVPLLTLGQLLLEMEGMERNVSLPRKKGVGTSGVHFRYHRPEEYNKLSHDQRKELSEWRAAQVEDHHGNKKKKPDQGALISAAVVKQMEEVVEKMRVDKISWRPPADEEPTTSKAAVKAFIMSAFEDDACKKPATKRSIAHVDANAELPAEIVIPPRKKQSTLSSILKDAKNLK